MVNTRIIPLMRKEFIHIIRDPRSLLILLFVPLLMLFIFGYAINMDLKNIRIGICDLSHTPVSRNLIDTLNASSYFKVITSFNDPRQSEVLFKKRWVRAVVIIPADFERTYMRTGSAPIGVITDGTDANSATLVQNYLEDLFMRRSLRLSAQNNKMPISIKVRMHYNADMESTYFVVPGIVALLLLMICALLTSVTIAREKENGTMEQILVSPIRRYEVVLGKAIPYLILSCIIAFFILAFGHIWFQVPMLGAWSWLMFFCVLYVFTALAIGLLISTIAPTQQVAIMLSQVCTLLPSVMLSGFIFPVASMPKVLQAISQIIPATHFLIIIRGIMLKGNGPAELWSPVLSMCAIGIFLIVLAVKRFKLKL